jgi:hypothetical protein
VTIERLLSVNADVTIDIGDDRVSVRGDGSSVVVEVPSISLAFQMLRSVGSIKPVRERVADLSQLLTSVGLTIVVRTPGRRLMTIGRDGNSWLFKLFGVPHARLHLS